MGALHAWAGDVDILRSHGSCLGDHIPGDLGWDIIVCSAGQCAVTASCAFGLVYHHRPFAAANCARFEGFRPSNDLRAGQDGCTSHGQFNKISSVDFYVAHFLFPFLFILW
jgi:hypothetical protein